jgi:uncharacterized phage protein (TIGR01671 family)
MREILFRGKRTDNSEWVRGYYVAANYSWHKRGVHRDWIVSAACANGGWFSIHGRYPVVTDTVGQYTGFTDKNGTKIFEGDVVKGFNNFHDREEQYVIRHTGVGLLFCEYGNEWHPDYIEQAEVIGNIYDNPELMEDE